MHILSKYTATASILCIFIVVGISTGTIFDTIPKETLSKYSYAAQYLLPINMETLRIFSAAMLTHGQGYFFRAALAILLCAGYLEYREGSRCAGIVFWGIHIITLLLLSAVFWFFIFVVGTSFFVTAYTIGDVGPSAGYFGCIGAIIASLHLRQHLYALGCVGIILASLGFHIISESGNSAVIADIAHMTAFMSSYILFSLYKYYTRAAK